MNNKEIVSIIVPVRNEEKYIEECILSILEQDYGIERIELIFVDGLSNDSTRNIIEKYIEMYPNTIILLENSQKTVPYAMNLGIRNSHGNYIIRMDAHSKYEHNYVSKCITTIINTGADNVGGLAIAKGKGLIGESFANVLSSKFGVGNSLFRLNSESGYVDTVPFGAYPKKTFSKYGMYDERLERNQDYELNWRIRKNGGKIYLNSDIKLLYYCRSSIKEIVKQSYENGKWNITTMLLCPGSMSLRHFVPFLFLVSLLIMPLLSTISIYAKYLLIFELVLYFTLDLIFSTRKLKKSTISIITFVLFPVFHLSYGFGSLFGVFYNKKR